MRLYADRLGGALRRRMLRVDDVTCPPFLDRPEMGGAAGKVDSYVGRFVTYPRVVRSLRADVVHVIDHGQAHLLSHVRHGARVVTCHDLILLVLAEGRIASRHRPPPVATRVLRSALAHLRSADAVVAVSEHTRRDLLDLCDIDPARVTVIHSGLNAPFRPDPQARERAARDLGLPEGPIVLHVGNTSFYKNVEGVLEVVARLRAGGLPVTLVRAGRRMTAAQSALARRRGVADHVLDLGPVPEGTLGTLYAAGDVLLFPSLYEGFGWPPLEAMAAGMPVVCSNAGALPEVVGGAALTAAPDDVGTLAAHVASVLGDGALRASLRARGLARAGTFDWDRTAESVERVYVQARGAIRAAPRRYRVYSALGRPVVAIAAGSPSERRAVGSVPVRTLRSAAVRAHLEVMSRLHLGALTSESHERLPGGVNVSAVERVIESLSEVVRHSGDPIILFPPPSRAGRLYVHLLSPEGDRIAFVKMAGHSADRARLETETSALANMAPVSRSFRVPRPYTAGLMDGVSYIASEALPPTARAVGDDWTGDLQAISDEVLGNPQLAPLRDCTWWPEVQASLRANPWLRPAVEAMSMETAPVGRVHGDFAPWNVFRDAASTWLIDWEFSVADGPSHTDRVRFFLARHHRLIHAAPGAVARHLVSRPPFANAEGRRAALLALVFLHTRGLAEATRVLRALLDRGGIW